MDIFTVTESGDFFGGARFKLGTSGTYKQHYIKTALEAPAGVAQNPSIGISNELLFSDDAIVLASGHHEEVLIRRASVALNREQDGQVLVPQVERKEGSVAGVLLYLPSPRCYLSIENDPSHKQGDTAASYIRYATLVPGLIRLTPKRQLRVKVSLLKDAFINSSFVLGFDGTSLLRWDGQPAGVEKLLWV